MNSYTIYLNTKFRASMTERTYDDICVIQGREQFGAVKVLSSVIFNKDFSSFITQSIVWVNSKNDAGGIGSG